MYYAIGIKTVRAMGNKFQRFVVAHVNLEGTDFHGNRVQSFAPRFIIAQSGDYRTAPEILPESLIATLRHKKITLDQLQWN